VVPHEYHDFLIGSSQASAALIGLLFVAVSLAPDRVFGAEASARHRAQALSAFTALANAFFTSMAGLIPDVNMGAVAIVAAAVSLVQTASLLFLWPRWREQARLGRAVFLLLVSAGVYAAELYAGVKYLGKVTDEGPIPVLFMCVLVMFFVGLSRAWELMGAADNAGLIMQIRRRLAPDRDRMERTEGQGT